MASEIAGGDRMQGDISETLRIAQLADVFGFGLSWTTDVSTSTAIHLMAGLQLEPPQLLYL